MKCHFLLLTLLISPLATAQTATSTSGSGSTAQVGVQASPQQALTFNSESPSKTTIRNVPSIFAPSFAPSTPCSSVLSASAGFAGFGLALGGSHVDQDCNKREMVRLLALIGQPDAALALVCDDESVRRTSPQLCSRAAYVSGKPEDYVSSQPPVMPPASVQPKVAAKAAIPEGSIGYGPDGKKFILVGGVWKPEATSATYDEGSRTNVQTK